MTIRPEAPSDAEVIGRVTLAAFETQPHSLQTEQFIVAALRAAGALTVSLVAELDDRVVGHVAFSPVSMSDGSDGWYALAPVSVLPELQRQGIGKALIEEGLSRLREIGAAGCILVGDPAYYERFGFRHVSGLVYEDAPADVFLVLPFSGAIPRGTVMFHPAFGAAG